jgi:hypothetical protein
VLVAMMLAKIAPVVLTLAHTQRRQNDCRRAAAEYE